MRLFPIPLLHLVYNTVAYAPAFAAFILLVRCLTVPVGAPRSQSTDGVLVGEH